MRLCTSSYFLRRCVCTLVSDVPELRQLASPSPGACAPRVSSARAGAAAVVAAASPPPTQPLRSEARGTGHDCTPLCWSELRAGRRAHHHTPPALRSLSRAQTGRACSAPSFAPRLTPGGASQGPAARQLRALWSLPVDHGLPTHATRRHVTPRRQPSFSRALRRPPPPSPRLRAWCAHQPASASSGMHGVNQHGGAIISIYIKYHSASHRIALHRIASCASCQPRGTFLSSFLIQ